MPWPAPVRIALILAGGVFACWLPYQLSSFDVSLYDRMGLYALVTIGLTLLMGYAGQISLGQGAFFLIGAYTSAILTVGLDPATRFIDPEAGISPLVAVLAAPVVTAVIAAVIGVPLLRLHGHYLAFATLALALIAFALPSAWDRFTGGEYGISVTKPLSVFGQDLRGPLHAAVVWAVVTVALLLATNLVHSRVGRALQAIATDETSAAASGIPVPSYKLRLFVFAAALAGLGGGLFTFSFLIVTPGAFPIVLSIQFVVMVAVGGLGNIYGAVAGSVAILYLEQELREIGARSELFGWDLPPRHRPSSRSACSVSSSSPSCSSSLVGSCRRSVTLRSQVGSVSLSGAEHGAPPASGRCPEANPACLVLSTVYSSSRARRTSTCAQVRAVLAAAADVRRRLGPFRGALGGVGRRGLRLRAPPRRDAPAAGSRPCSRDRPARRRRHGPPQHRPSPSPASAGCASGRRRSRPWARGSP